MEEAGKEGENQSKTLTTGNIFQVLRCQELYSEKYHVVISIFIFQMRKLKYQEIKLLIQNHIVGGGVEIGHSFFF